MHKDLCIGSTFIKFVNRNHFLKIIYPSLKFKKKIKKKYIYIYISLSKQYSSLFSGRQEPKYHIQGF